MIAKFMHDKITTVHGIHDFEKQSNHDVNNCKMFNLEVS